MVPPGRGDVSPHDPNHTDMVDTGPQDLVVRAVENEYPRGADYAKKGYFLASVTYGPNPENSSRAGFWFAAVA